MKEIEILKISKNLSKSIFLIQKENSDEIGNNIWNVKEIESLLSDKSFFGIVCVQKKSIKAFSLAREIDDFLELISIFVIPSSRNKGFGVMLLEKCRKFCKSRNLKEIILEVREDNQAAKNFYLKNNFFIYGKRKDYYEVDGKKIDAHKMKLKIS